MLSPKKLILTGAALLAAAFYFAAPRDALQILGLSSAQRLPDFSLTDQDGTWVDRDSCEARPTLVFVWDLDQRTSAEVEPMLNSLYAKYGKDRLCFLPVAVQAGADRILRDEYISSHGARFPVYGVGYNSGYLPPPLWPPHAPYVFLADRAGVIRRQWFPRPSDAEDIDAAVEGFVNDGSADAEVSDGSVAAECSDCRVEKEFKASVRGLLAARSFADLDKLADEARSTKARFPDGSWKLSALYSAAGFPERVRDDGSWEDEIALLGQWKQLRPDSITARVALAGALAGWAFKGRGSGSGASLTAEDGGRFSERLALARKEIDEAEKLPIKCPGLYAVMQRVAKGQGWERPEYDALFKKATAYEPDYLPYYYLNAGFLAAEWYGSAGEQRAAAQEGARATQDRSGMELYARIAWYTMGRGPRDGNGYRSPSRATFDRGQFPWPALRQGFLDMEKRYPSSEFNRNVFAQFACWAGDKQTARQAFAALGEHYDAATWGSRIRYDHWRRWAGGS